MVMLAVDGHVMDETEVEAAINRIFAGADTVIDEPESGWATSPYGARRVEDTMAYSMLDAPSREQVDAAVFRIANMNARLTLAQAQGDRAAALIIEGQLAAMRA
jgi:hypothetical protein